MSSENKVYPQFAQVGQSTGPATVVVQRPAQIVVQDGRRPADFLILSIVGIFFCWPMATCAIVYSLNSRKSCDLGDFDQAEKQGRRARDIGIPAIVSGIIIIIIAVVVPIAVAASAVSTYCSNPRC